MTDNSSDRTAVEGQVDTFLFRVPDLVVPRAFVVGSVRLYPPGSTTALVEEARIRRGWRHDWYDDVIDGSEVAEFDTGTVIAVEADDERSAYDLAADGLGVLRLFQPTTTPMVDVHRQTFGLEGEVTRWSVDYFRLGGGPTAGWFHGGAFPGWTFSEEHVTAFEADAGLQFLAHAIRPSGREQTALERRLVLGMRILNSSILDYNSDRKMLTLMSGLEVLLGDPDWTTKKYGLARRAAFLSCGMHNGEMCGRDRDICPYLALNLSRRGKEPVELTNLVTRARRDTSVLCSSYMEIIGAYEARNSIIHGGSSEWSFDDIKQLTWRVHQWIIPPLLAWCATNPDRDISGLDDDIRALARTRPVVEIPPEEDQAP